MSAPTLAVQALAAPDEFEVSSPRPSEGLERLSVSSSRSVLKPAGFKASIGLANIGRRALGIFLLMVTVFLWTASNFLASNIFADNTFSKPYFVTYTNTAFFAISLVPISIRIAHKDGLSEIRQSLRQFWQRRSGDYSAVSSKTDDEPSEDPLSASQTGLISRRSSLGLLTKKYTPEGVLSLSETARLSLEFCMLWFLANYLVAACLEYTSVASSTILTSTSSIWTLLFGALVRVEQFSWKKFTGVMASLAGIILISTVDLSRKDNDDNRGNFPHKSKSEIALGDAMAFGSAVMYGIYAVVMKKRIGNEDRVNMPLFFGLVGLFNMVLLWPGFFILHFTGIEKFELPPTKKVAAIVLSNSTASFISDYCWAYAMLLTTPLVTTVGLSLTIPLSLIGQMILSHQYSSALYWVGALIVLLSFLFINHESKEEVEPPQARDLDVVV